MGVSPIDGRWRFALALAAAMVCLAARADGAGDEFAVKREAVFEFAAKPTVSREGDRVTIRFATKARCDVTVAVEDAKGRVIRHLASGVLGDNAPPPFQKGSTRQTIVWDGKLDTGKYVEDKSACTVRVSLGLRARLERTLFWSPHKRIANIAPLLATTDEGVLVFEGQGVDLLKLFDRDGGYVRTIYPFPAGAVGKVAGLQTHKYEQDGLKLPLKIGYNQGTLLSSGSSGQPADTGGHYGGYAASAMAVHGKKIALASHFLNRLTTDGAGGLPIKGPATGFAVIGNRRLKMWAGPTSMAFSPDGKVLYLTGFVWKTAYWATHGDSIHAVLRMDYASQDPPTLLAGSVKLGDYGAGNDKFCAPLSVDTDAAGRVYVADSANHRIQVFSPAGEFLKTLPTRFPAKVLIDKRNGEIYSFSWGAIGPPVHVQKKQGLDFRRMPPTLARLGTFAKGRAGKPEPLPVVAATGNGGWTETGGQVYQTAIDFAAKAATLWVVGRRPTLGVAEMNWSGGGVRQLAGWPANGVRLFTRGAGGQWAKRLDFAAVAAKKVHRVEPPPFARQRLIVNPANGKLYVAEDMTHFGKSFFELLEIDPETGRQRAIRMPFDAEDMTFDIAGRAYLRTDTEIVRYLPGLAGGTWREIPWDYGEERESVGFISSRGGARSPAVSALAIPGRRPVWWHSAGMWINAKGHLAVACVIREKARERNPKDKYLDMSAPKPYAPRQYPGRAGKYVIHIFDRHGKLIHEDAAPGLPGGDGIGIDAEDDLYVMVAATRVRGGRAYFNEKSETLMKFRPGKAKLLSSARAPVALPEGDKPKRSADLTRYGIGPTWAKGAEWAYGGVGYGGQGGSCVCWHARFQLDMLGRSFVPEVRRFRVAVLDSAGNLIMRIGRYGNVDDGKPLVPAGGPAGARSIGGDEVALCHGAYVGIHTDRRLFICDGGNGRILSVKLDYHAEEKVRLADGASPKR